MPILTFDGRDYVVEIDNKVTKADLIGFSIDGKHRGNVRVYPDEYRIGWKTTKRTLPRATPIDDVILEAARLYLEHEKEKKANRRKR